MAVTSYRMSRGTGVFFYLFHGLTADLSKYMELHLLSIKYYSSSSREKYLGFVVNG